MITQTTATTRTITPAMAAHLGTDQLLELRADAYRATVREDRTTRYAKARANLTVLDEVLDARRAQDVAMSDGGEM